MLIGPFEISVCPNLWAVAAKFFVFHKAGELKQLEEPIRLPFLVVGNINLILGKVLNRIHSLFFIVLSVFTQD